MLAKLETMMLSEKIFKIFMQPITHHSTILLEYITYMGVSLCRRICFYKRSI